MKLIFDFLIEEQELLKALKLDEEKMKIISTSVNVDEAGRRFIKLLIESDG